MAHETNTYAQQKRFCFLINVDTLKPVYIQAT